MLVCWVNHDVHPQCQGASDLRLAWEPGQRHTSNEPIRVHAADSVCMQTVEVEVTTSLGMFRADVPSGASTGIYEALELRDGGKEYHGKGTLMAYCWICPPKSSIGVSKAVSNVNTIIAPAIKGMNPVEQTLIDKKVTLKVGSIFR